MKAKVIKTGEIVNVIPVEGGWWDTDYSTYSHHYNDKELDFDIQDWASFRREAAKSILCSIVEGGYSLDRIKSQTNLAITYTDELIKQLQKEDEQ